MRSKSKLISLILSAAICLSLPAMAQETWVQKARKTYEELPLSVKALATFVAGFGAFKLIAKYFAPEEKAVPTAPVADVPKKTDEGTEIDKDKKTDDDKKPDPKEQSAPMPDVQQGGQKGEALLSSASTISSANEALGQRINQTPRNATSTTTAAPAAASSSTPGIFHLTEEEINQMPENLRAIAITALQIDPIDVLEFINAIPQEHRNDVIQALPSEYRQTYQTFVTIQTDSEPDMGAPAPSSVE